MKKSEVQLNYHDDGHGCPCLNVKVNYPIGVAWRALAERVESEEGMPGFADWFDALPDDGSAAQWAFDAACESGADAAVEMAGEIFGAAFGQYDHKHRRVFQTGRSGGWLYVEGLPDVETWDAVQLAKWARFARVCEEIVDGIPFDGTVLLALNTYAAQCEAFAEAERMAETVAADAMAGMVHA